ncbi:MAG: S41 family peptidase [Longimicrobiales bacterium]
MRIKRSILAPLVVALIAFATGGWLLQQGVSSERNVYATAQLFEDVLRHVSAQFVDEKSPGELYRLAIDGMLEELGDPHSVFMTAEEYEDLRIQTQGEYGGIGIQIAERNGWITILSPLPGTPGERAGLRAGDAIIEVEGESTREWTEDEAVANLRGPRGSKVNMKIARVGVDDPIPFTITREEIHIQSVTTSYMIPGNVGYVQLSVFSESSVEEVSGALDQLREQGARGVILDMRNNPGGLLDAGIAISDLFLERGQLIAETKGRDARQSQKAVATTADAYPGMPIVLLVGPSSASATEIVAGALQDHDRALVLGRTTYGKGSVQSLYQLPDENWLKLTTARWYTPVGRSIQGPYGIDAMEHAVQQDSMSQDSVGDRPEYETDSGRTVYGGGGITPDLIVNPDTLTTQEQLYLEALQSHGSKYYETRFAYAVVVARDNPNLEREFAVTPAMMSGFHEALGRAGIVVDDAVFEGASRLIRRELGYEVAYAKWGQAEARRHLNEGDRQIEAAAELLRQASSPATLFRLAAERGSDARVARPGGQ